MNDINEWREVKWAVCGLVVLACGVFGFGWYKAGLQADQYHRQGISLSQWECFMGVKPAETVIQVRGKDGTK